MSTTAAGSPLLDSVRAGAVLLVLVAHGADILAWQAGQDTPAMLRHLGRNGVLLFFVHTALVLMMSLSRLSGSRLEVARTFYRRRAWRIYPLAVVTVLLVWIAQVPSLGVPPYQPVSMFTLASNLLLVQDLTGAPNVLIPLWSLPIEVLMYVTLPGLFWTIAPNTRAVLLVWAGAAAFWLLAGSAGTRLWEYVPCFLCGILAYSLWGKVVRRLPFWSFVLLVALAIVGYSVVTRALGGPVHVVPVQWGLCLIVGSLLPFTIQPTSPFGNRVSLEVAKYSYGIYLGHLPALWLALVVWSAPLWLQIPAALALTGLFAVAAYHLIEAPGIRFGQRVRVPRPVALTVPARP